MNERAETHACDLIERQAARLAKCPFDGLNDYQRGWNDACDAIADNAPSAQLELANNSPKVDRGFGEWIPCSERLPEHSKRYLVSVLDGIDRRTTVAPYLPRSRTWSLTGRMAYWKVIAWMPLPSPYEERREE